MVLGRSTIGVRKVYHCIRKVYHGVRKVYHGVRKVYHGVERSTMAMKGLVCSRALQKHITLRGQRIYMIPSFMPPWPPHRAPPIGILGGKELGGRGTPQG